MTWSAGSCLNFEKGSFSGNVTSKEICRTACEKAEGLCCPDFKENEGSFKCSCISCETCPDKETRSLCEDESFSTSDANKLIAGPGFGGVVVMGMLLTSLI